MTLYKSNTMTDVILRTKSYYATGIDPRHYYKTDTGSPLERKAIRATQYKDIYLSDLLNNPTCSVIIEKYRDKDDVNAPLKTSGWNDVKHGTVIGYNPVTNLVAVECNKKRPSRVSALFKRTKKIRYADPINMVVSLGRFCLLKPVNLTPRSVSRGTPKGVAKGTPKGVSTGTPKGVAKGTPKGVSRGSPKGTFKGGKTRKRK